MNVEITLHIWREGQQFVAHALPLDVMSSGPTSDAACRAVDEAVQCFLKTTADSGTLEQVLRDCGYERAADGWVIHELQRAVAQLKRRGS